MNCEGAKGVAESILAACPLSKNVLQDKLCYGIFEENNLIAFVDLLKSYPSPQTLTIGYLLIHPNYQSIGLGANILFSIKQWANAKGFKTLRVIVQEKNPRALAFWERNNFIITEKLMEELHTKGKLINILECEL